MLPAGCPRRSPPSWWLFTFFWLRSVTGWGGRLGTQALPLPYSRHTSPPSGAGELQTATIATETFLASQDGALPFAVSGGDGNVEIHNVPCLKGYRVEFAPGRSRCRGGSFRVHHCEGTRQRREKTSLSSVCVLSAVVVVVTSSLLECE